MNNVIFLILLTLIHLRCLNAQESILSTGKLVYYDLNGTNLTTFISPGKFEELSFDSFMFIDLGSMHYIVNVTMKLHYNSKQFFHLSPTT